MQKLTFQQEQFAQAIMKGLKIGEAYKLAGYHPTNRNSQDASAARLLRSAKIASRLEEMAVAKRISEAVSVHSVTDMLATVFDAASRDKQHGAAATAAMGIAKLHGLLVDKLEDVTRRPARSPDAPLEIEVEHWLTEHKLIGQDKGSNIVDTTTESPTLESPNISEGSEMFD